MADEKTRESLMNLIVNKDSPSVPDANKTVSGPITSEPEPEPRTEEGGEADVMFVPRPYVPERIGAHMRLQAAHRDALKALAHKKGVGKQPELLEEALELLFEKHGVKFSPPKGPKKPQIRKAN